MKNFRTQSKISGNLKPNGCTKEQKEKTKKRISESEDNTRGVPNVNNIKKID